MQNNSDVSVASSMLPHLDGLEFLDRFTEGWP